MNYENKVMNSVYEILTKEDFKWSNEFDLYMMRDLVEVVLNHFIDIEDYEKCAKLQPMLDSMEMKDESYNKTVITGSGKL
jgi:hypothetical protein